MEINKRLPLLDELIDACRMLPETVQAVFAVFMMIGLSVVTQLAIQNIQIAIIIVEVFFIGVLLVKNIVYRRISKIDNAIDAKIIWIKSKLDAERKKRYLWISLILLLLMLLIYVYLKNNNFLIIGGLLCVLFSLKNLFYVPLIFIRIVDDQNLELVNDFHKTVLSFPIGAIKKLVVKHDVIKIEESAAKATFLLDFHELKERKRLLQFFKTVLPTLQIKEF